MLEVGKLYKWKGWTDVAFQVLEVEDRKLNVMWYNIGKCHPIYCMGLTQRITIPEGRELEYYEYVEN